MDTNLHPPFFLRLETPLGVLSLSANDSALSAIHFGPLEHPVCPNGILENSSLQLSEYFAGKRKKFQIPLQIAGTPFQYQVWQTLREIPYGQLISYAQLAQRLGNLSAIRAVATANGKNPIPIIVPCHRVIGSDGSLTGYSGGLDNKRFLIDLEAQTSGTTLS
jgi:methylated-DNA-[protein]-cysteine S-methyltransferase